MKNEIYITITLSDEEARLLHKALSRLVEGEEYGDDDPELELIQSIHDVLNDFA